MKSSSLFILMFLTIIFMPLYACDKIVIIGGPRHILSENLREERPRGPVPLGCIRGYFGDSYRTFTQHIEKVQPIDSFSNCYFYGSCNSSLNQINLIRCSSEFVLAMYIMGYSLDSLPAALPVPVEFGKFSEIQFYPFQSWNSGSPGHYSLIDFYEESVFITDKTDDILTGTFEGTLRSSTGDIMPVSEGEFKIKIFRKYMPCGQDNGK